MSVARESLFRQPDSTTMIWGATAQAIMVSLAYTGACAMAAMFCAAAILKLGTEATGGGVIDLTHFTVLSLRFFFDALAVAFWPSLAVVALTEGLRIRGIVSYTLAGLGVGLFTALPVTAFVNGDPLPVLSAAVVQLFVAAGAVAGVTYWLIAGRTAGKWLSLRLFEEERWV